MSQIGEAFVRVRPLATGFGADLDRQAGPGLRRFERQLASTNKEFGRFGRGALVGTGALGGLGRAAAFASTSFIGGAGLIYAIKSTISAAMESQVVLGQTENAVTRAGLSWEQYGQKIQKAALAQSQISGFDDERLLRTFSTFVRRTGDVNRALTLNALAANVARGRNIELEQATQLVLKATLGQAGALRRLGIDAPKGAKALELINLLTEKYGKSAITYADSAAGAQARFGVAIQNTQEAIGAGLLPTITELLNKGTAWLNQESNQERIQRDVNKAVEDGTKIVHGLADGLAVAKSVADPLISTVGGLKNAVELLLIAMAVAKVRAFAGALGLIGPAAVTAGGAVATAEAEIAAGGAAAGTAATKVSGLRGALLQLGAIGAVTIAINEVFNERKQTQALNAINALPVLGDNLIGHKVGGKPFRGPDGQMGTLQMINGNLYFVPTETASTPNFFSTGLDGIKFPAGADLPGSVSGSNLTGAGNLSAYGRNQLALSDAARSPSTADDLKALREQRALLAGKIADETARLQNAPNAKAAQKFADNLKNLQDADASAYSQIASIEDQAARDAQAARDKIKAAAAKAERERLKTIRDVVRSGTLALQAAVTNLNEQERYKAAQKKARETAAKAALTLREGALNLARQAADLAVARAGDNQTLLDKATELERKADRRLIAFYKERIAATKGLTKQNYQQQLLAAQIDLAGLSKKAAAAKTGATGFTLAELFKEATSEAAQYGSNYGPAGTPLSPQDARGGYADTVKTHQTIVVQNFHGPTQPNQAMNDARASARNLK